MFYGWIYWLCDCSIYLIEKEFLKLTQNPIITEKLIQKLLGED